MRTHSKIAKCLLNRHQWPGLIVLSLVLLRPATLLAQPTPPPTASVLSVQQQANQLVARTQPGYYQALLIPDWRRRQANRQEAFTAADRLCSFVSKTAQPTRSLRAERLDERQVRLTWTRSDEPATEPVVIERSLDPAGGFEPVGWLPATGRAETLGQLLDANAHTGNSYYRLTWTNAAGQSVSGPPIAIRGVEVRLRVKAFPNPGPAASLQFEVAGQSAGAVSVAFYDVQGRTLYQNQRMALDEAGRFSLPTSLVLPAGQYYVRVLTQTHPATTAFVVQP